MARKSCNGIKKKAILLITLFGIISLLGDVIYEGARSVNGPFLKTLGANAAIVGLVIGLGELISYVIRLLSGYFSDKKGAYWFFVFIGYGLLISIPLLSLSGFWQMAAIFIILERIGKGFRSPARDTIVSHAAKRVGTGVGFGISELLDQIGAVAGPLIFAFFFMGFGAEQKGVADYQQGYALLWLPFSILMFVLFLAYMKIKTPSKLEEEKEQKKDEKIPRVFWHYTLFTFATTFGFVGFALIGYHLKANNIVNDSQIPLLYAFAMMVDAIFGLIIGKAYDSIKARQKKEHAGLLLLVLMPIFTATILPLAFSLSVLFVMVAMFLWGIVMGMHETIMRAAIADMTSIKKRGTGYGIFNAVYGLAMFMGSAIAGYLYEISIPIMVMILAFTEIISIVPFAFMRKEIK